MRFARTHATQPGQCFVIMPFGEKPLRDGEKFDWDKHYRSVLERAIREAGMVPSRADELYGPQPLLDRLWRGIQEAEVILADLTGRSPNVLYEVGLAHVIGKKILILTMYPDDVPVDLGEFVHIKYSKEGYDLFNLVDALKKNLEEARKQPAAEANLTPLRKIDIRRIPATVIHIAERVAALELADGTNAFLKAEDSTWGRPRDLRATLTLGQRLDGALVIDYENPPKYSLVADKPNPWIRLKEEFPIGSSFAGRIVNVIPAGAFVEMRDKIHGFIPKVQLPGDLAVHDRVKVQVVNIDTIERKVQLRFLEKLPYTHDANRKVDPNWGPFQKGQGFEGRVSKVQLDKGFTLVEVQAGERPVTGMLHNSRMSPALRRQFLDGELRRGDVVHVEINSVDDERQRLDFRDSPFGHVTPETSLQTEAESAN